MSEKFCITFAILVPKCYYYVVAVGSICDSILLAPGISLPCIGLKHSGKLLCGVLYLNDEVLDFFFSSSEVVR